MDDAKPVHAQNARRLWAQELRAVWRSGWANFRRKWWVLAAAVAFGVAVIYLQNGQDRALLNEIRSSDESVQYFAGRASKWGDWPGWAALGFLVWAAGAMFGKISWRQAGLACLLATLMAGVTINCFRPTMGRPRPFTEIPDGLYGPHFHDTKYHAFMSGHTAASFAAATALVIAVPPVGIPAAAGAAVVGWSRMQLNKHNPSDVMTAGAVGILWGWCFGRAVSRRESGSMTNDK